MFHSASPALSVPARSPTRGSGYGSPADMSLMGGRVLLVRDELVADAQAAALNTAASDSAIFDLVLKTEFMAIPRVNRIPRRTGMGGWWTGATGYLCRALLRPAVSPSAQSRCSDRR